MTGKFDAYAFSRGDVARNQRNLEKDLERKTAARRLENSAVGSGGVRVHSGGGVTLEDGGGITVEDGGSVVIRGGGGLTIEDAGESTTLYEDGSVAMSWGSISPSITPNRHGLSLQSRNGTDLLLAADDPDSAHQTQLLAGQAEDPVDFIGFIGGVQAGLTCVGGGDILLYTDGVGGDIFIECVDGSVFISPHPTTTATTPVCILNSDGLIQRSTSSARYKQDIEDAEIDPAEVMQLRPRVWRDKGEVAADPDAGWHVGLVAEEVAEVLPEFVSRDADGEVEAVAYDRLSVALLEVVRGQQTRMDALAARLAALDGKTEPVIEVHRTRRPLPRRLPTRTAPTPAWLGRHEVAPGGPEVDAPPVHPRDFPNVVRGGRREP